MEEFIKGDIVVVPFPFSDLSATKRRPALVIANTKNQDILLCQITSQSSRDTYAVPIEPNDYNEGILHKESYVRLTRIFTADKTIILYKVTTLKKSKMLFLTKKLIHLLES